MEDTIVKIVDLENEINRDIDRLVDLKAEARRLIGQVKEPDQQLVLELRYLCYKPWSEIMVELGCSEPTVYRLHGEALKKIVLPGNLIGSDMQ
jgi:DNA-directed RNA polymerase specialized sigma subunit